MNQLRLVSLLFLGACAEAAPPPPAAPPEPPPAAPSAPAAPPPAATAAPAAEVSKLAAPETPEAIRVPSSPAPVLKGNAVGVQIYTCGPKKDDKHAFEWTLKAPEASLADDAGKPLAKHYGGPTWEATDGSKVAGSLKAKVDSPDSAAIPWLLIESKSNEGQGALANIAWIQRVQTVGGKAPATGCDKAHIGAESRVDYRATYYFYSR